MPANSPADSSYLCLQPHLYRQTDQTYAQIITSILLGTETSKYLRYDIARYTSPLTPPGTRFPPSFAARTMLNCFVTRSITGDLSVDESLRIQIGYACQTVTGSLRAKRIGFGIQWRRPRCPYGRIGKSPCAPSSTGLTLRTYAGASDRSLLSSSQDMIP
jgi:hypothetical protein